MEDNLTQLAQDAALLQFKKQQKPVSRQIKVSNKI
jgi:hypothetical protein